MSGEITPIRVDTKRENISLSCFYGNSSKAQKIFELQGLAQNTRASLLISSQWGSDGSSAEVRWMLSELEQNWETFQSIREVLSSFSQDRLLLKLKKRVSVARGF